jgi:hypothetical protein
MSPGDIFSGGLLKSVPRLHVLLLRVAQLHHDDRRVFAFVVVLRGLLLFLLLVLRFMLDYSSFATFREVSGRLLFFPVCFLKEFLGRVQRQRHLFPTRTIRTRDRPDILIHCRFPKSDETLLFDFLCNACNHPTVTNLLPEPQHFLLKKVRPTQSQINLLSPCLRPPSFSPCSKNRPRSLLGCLGSDSQVWP